MAVVRRLFRTPREEEEDEEEDTAVLNRFRFCEDECTLPVSSAIDDRDLTLSDSVQQLRSFDEEEQTNEECLFLVGCDAVYISDEEGVQSSSDVNLDESSAVSEAVSSINRMKRLNTDLQRSLDVSEDYNSALRDENASLKSQIRTLRQITQHDGRLKDELDCVRAAKLELEQTCSELEASKKLLEKKTEALNDQFEAVSSELSSLLAEKETYKRETEELSQLVVALQRELMENRLQVDAVTERSQEKDVLIKQLEDTIGDYRIIQKDLKERNQDLEGQLALALVSGCTFMNVDSALETDGQRSVSLGEELGLLPGEQMKCGREEERGEEEERVEEEPLSVEEEEEEEENPEEHKEEVKPGNGACSEGAAVTVEEARRSGGPVRCDGVSRRVAAGVLGLGLLVPLGLLRALAPVLCDPLGPSCADVVWITVRRLLQPHCCVYHSGLPPV